MGSAFFFLRFDKGARIVGLTYLFPRPLDGGGMGWG